MGAGIGLYWLSQSTSRSPFARPVKALRISSPFGRRVDPVTKEKGSYHTGVDFSAPVGVPVHAPEAGVVVRVDRDGIDKGKTNGNAVHVKAASGRVWSMLHLSRVVVSQGQQVRAGKLVGNVGNTGRSTGPHLHLSLYEGGKYVDPMRYLRGHYRIGGMEELSPDFYAHAREGAWS